MSNSGKHTITSSTPPPDPPDGGGIGPIQTIFNVIFYIFLIVITIKWCAEPSKYPNAPTAPNPPTTGYATFEAANSHGTSALSLVLGGGNYEFVYKSADSLASVLNGMSGTSVYTADFATGQTSGDPQKADTLVLVGSLKLSVGSLSNKDSIYVNVLSRGHDISAYFNYSTSPRGPPVPMISRTKKTIIVVGEIKDVNIQSGYGESTRDIRILDLNPSENEEREYREASARYSREIETYRIQQRYEANRPRPAHR